MTQLQHSRAYIQNTRPYCRDAHLPTAALLTAAGKRNQPGVYRQRDGWWKRGMHKEIIFRHNENEEISRKWRDLEIILTQETRIQKDKYCTFSLACRSQLSLFICTYTCRYGLTVHMYVLVPVWAHMYVHVQVWAHCSYVRTCASMGSRLICR